MKSSKQQWQFSAVRKWFTASTKSNTAAAVNASDDLLWTIVLACGASVAVLDEFGTVLYASRPWRLFEQKVNADAQGAASYQEIFTSFSRFGKAGRAADPSRTLADDIQTFLAGTEKEFHGKYYQRSGRKQRPLMMHVAQLDLPGSIVKGLITFEKVDTSEKRLTQLLDDTKILAWEAELASQQFTYVSEHAFQMLGYPVGEWYEPDFFATHIHPDDRDLVFEAYRKENRIADDFDVTFRMLASDGHIVWIQNLVSMDHETNTPGFIHGFMIDVTARKRAEQALRALSGRLILAQEEERKRIGLDLHDDLSQRLAVMAIDLSQIEDDTDENDTRKQLRKVRTQVQDILSDVHRLSHRLHPSSLDHMGVATAIKTLCEEISQTGKLKVSFLQHDLPADLPKDIALCLYRIAQELLHNCLKHSEAQFAEVYLQGNGNNILLMVSDNGRGFDPKSRPAGNSLGLIGVKERLEMVGGNMKILSASRNGTRINISVPLNGELVTGSPRTDRPPLRII
jgi:PAS domain S-box-containing protein